jgi:hypothetical protein
VIYRPQTERQSHYFDAALAQQFDAVIHFDETRAVEPLEYTSGWETGELPETYPWAVQHGAQCRGPSSVLSCGHASAHYPSREGRAGA